MTKDELVFFPDLPPFPEQLFLGNDTYDIKCTPRITIRDGKEILPMDYTKYKVSKRIQDWVDENVGSDHNQDIGISVMGKGISPPHTDQSRYWALMWLFETGGSEVDTVHWREKNQPYIRVPFTFGTDYSNLIEICRHRFQVGQWVFFSTQCLHSVENMVDGSRTALQIGFKDDAPTVAKLKELSQQIIA